MKINLPKALNKKVIIIAIVALAVAVIVCVAMLIINATKDKYTTELAGSDNPASYDLSEKERQAHNDKFYELLEDLEHPNSEAVYNYFTDEINANLAKGFTKRACVTLWVEHDNFMANQLYNEALESLLRMDDSKLEHYQKDYLYRAIVSASVVTGNKELEDKYTALVQELGSATQAQ